MDKVKNILIRIYIYKLLLLFFISGGLAPLILMPAYKQAFFPRARYRDIKFLALWLFAYKIVWRTLSDKNYRDAFTIKITCPPRAHTDTRFVRVKENWSGEPNDCDLCEAACCGVLKCPLLDKNKRCLSYGSLFFTYLHCGRYPESQEQIEYYQCPKWEVVGKDVA